MKTISESDVLKAVSPSEALILVERAHRDLQDGTAVNVVRSRARSNKFTLHSLPSLSTILGYSAIKVYSSIGAMAACHVLLYKISNGELVAMIEARELGRLRTAAAAIIAAGISTSNALGKVLIVGAGYQGEGLIHSLATQADSLGVESISVSARNFEKLKVTSKELAAKYHLNIAPVLDLNAADQLVKTIFLATTAVDPISVPTSMTSLRHISSLGANSLVRREISSETIVRATRIIVDDIEVAKVESGSLLPLIESGKKNWNQILTLGHYIEQRGCPSKDSQGYRVFLSHGLGVQDLYLAASVYEKLQKS